MNYNHLGRAIVSSGNEAEYDTAVKELLADKQILAWILKWTTEEFKNLEIEKSFRALNLLQFQKFLYTLVLLMKLL